MNINYLTDIEHDALKEVMSIGAGNASASLSKLIKQDVAFTVPNLWLIPIEEVSGLMGGIEQVMTILAIKMTDGISGIALFLLTNEDAARLAGALSSQEKNSVLEEIFNIIVGSSLTALANFLRLSFRQSIPASASDMLRAVINEVVAQMGEQTNKVLLLKANIKIEAIAVTGDLYFLFDPASSKKMLASCDATVIKNNG